MIRALRSRHRWLWLILAMALPAALLGALLARAPWPRVDALPRHETPVDAATEIPPATRQPGLGDGGGAP